MCASGLPLTSQTGYFGIGATDLTSVQPWGRWISIVSSFAASASAARSAKPMKAHLLGLVAVHEWTCSPAMVTRYPKRISGPPLDPIDIHIEVPRVDCNDCRMAVPVGRRLLSKRLAGSI